MHAAGSVGITRYRGVDRLRVTLEVRVDYERGAQLVILVAEVDGGVVPARHFDPLGPVRFAMWDVCSKQVSPAKHVEAVDARVSGSLVSGSLGDEATGFFYENVVTFLAVGE